MEKATLIKGLYNVEYPDLGVSQQKVLIDHSAYQEYLEMPYETKVEQEAAKKWLKKQTGGMEWFTEKSPFYEAITTGLYRANLKESIKLKITKI